MYLLDRLSNYWLERIGLMVTRAFYRNPDSKHLKALLKAILDEQEKRRANNGQDK